MAINTHDENSPKAEAVLSFHRNAPVDTSRSDIHHTLGPGSNQAAAGSHMHNGNDSPQLLGGVLITGGTADAKINSIIAAIARLGAIDETTNG